MKALLLVDIQNDFLPGGALEVPAGDKIIPVINELQNYFELVVITQDWHPPDHKSFASSHVGKKPFDVIELNGLQQTLWPDHCVQGTSGASFPVAFNTNKAEAIFRKGTDPEIDSYSGFYDNGHRKSTCLADYLRGKKVKEVYITGLCGDICVFYTAMDSLKEGFETYIIEDGTCPLKKEDFITTMQVFKDKGGMIIQSGSLPAALNIVGAKTQ
ncbi:bifunctional nicotinamidase/pyrazinamidase [Panacibacter ginsenosidivorans]|uniref:Nicotinamidase n=1 Tax=Panacibacter ginsenosidivorans TaxID=1813871 RepID=A0A5B8VF93_9BACT|nr:bifunctional nicotinamidase/pyrazinamidase [Panacibacter ginsenosidivorans]QEC69196.1 bifunctional nicotinamidase/pyrazinamidase [Panacibacter ginsenosidivorans]